MTPIDPNRQIPPVQNTPVQGPDTASKPIQRLPDQTVQSRQEVQQPQSPVQQAPAAVGGHQKSWKSHFAHMQNPTVIVIKKRVLAELKRITQDQKIVHDKIKNKKQRESDEKPEYEEPQEEEEEEEEEVEEGEEEEGDAH